jgi:hypothetical protein
MKHFTVGNIVCDVPEKWEEVTLEQLLKINTGITKPLELISVFTLPLPELNKLTDFELIEQIELCLLFTQDVAAAKDLLSNYEKPTHFVFNKEEIRLPSDIGVNCLAQYQDLKLLMVDYFNEEEDNTILRLSVYTKTIATYLQPIIDKSEYDAVRVDQIALELYKYPAVEVAAWGNFFIQRFSELRSGIMSNVQKSTIPQKNQRQGFLSFLNRLGLKQLSTVSQMGTSRNKTLS